MKTKIGDIIQVKVGNRKLNTIIDEHGVQRFVPINPIYKYLREQNKLDFNNLSIAYQTGQIPFKEYLDLYLSIGYSVSGFSELSAFQHLTIQNPLWE